MDQIVSNPGIFDVVGKGTFLEGLKLLKIGGCEAIFGPQGGIVVLNDQGVVVYRTIPKGYKGIYFSVDNYLGTWKFLKADYRSGAVPDSFEKAFEDAVIRGLLKPGKPEIKKPQTKKPRRRIEC